jgi:hypothetical protein
MSVSYAEWVAAQQAGAAAEEAAAPAILNPLAAPFIVTGPTSLVIPAPMTYRPLQLSYVHTSFELLSFATSTLGKKADFDIESCVLVQQYCSRTSASYDCCSSKYS